MGTPSGFSQVDAAGFSQAMDFNITESQLGSTQVDFSFLDFNATQEEGGASWADGEVPPASQARRAGHWACLHRDRAAACSVLAAAAALAAAHCRCRPPPRRRSSAPPPQVPTFQPTQGDADLGLDAALSQLHFQDATEAEQEAPTELPEWACA